MREVYQKDFTIEGLVSSRGWLADVVRGIYIPTGMQSALKLYRLYMGKCRTEAATLEKLADTGYVPQLVGVGEISDSVWVPNLEQPGGMRYLLSREPFLADEWVTGVGILSLYYGRKDGSNPFKEEGKTIIHQYLDFIEQCRRKGIYVSDLKDVLWVPDKKRIIFPDVGINHDYSSLACVNGMLAEFVEYVMREARMQGAAVGDIRPNTRDKLEIPTGLGSIGSVEEFKGLTERYERYGFSKQVDRDVLNFVDRFNNGAYLTDFGRLESDLVNLLESKGYVFQKWEGLTLPPEKLGTLLREQRESLERFNKGGPTVDYGEFARTFSGGPELTQKFFDLSRRYYGNPVPRREVIGLIKAHLAETGKSLESIVDW